MESEREVRFLIVINMKTHRCNYSGAFLVGDQIRIAVE